MAQTQRGRSTNRRNSDRVSLRTQYEKLQNSLLEALGDAVTNITTDGQLVSPAPGKPSVLIEPPDLTSESWDEIEAVWKIDVIAGTTTTQALSIFECLDVIDKLVSAKLNIASATAITFRNNGVNLAGYQLTLNPLD